MGTQLPRWVWVGAVTLACIAGMVNVVGYLGFEHQAVSHLTGTTSLLGAALADGDWRAVGNLWGMLIAFSLGATLSGMIISAFLAGGILGAWLFRLLQYYALLIPAALTGLTGIGYAGYRHWSLRQQG